MKIILKDIHQFSANYQVIKGLFIWLILLVINSACSVPPQTSVKAISNPNAKCPDKPVGSLDSKNVKQIQLSSQTVTESGQVRAGEYLGYAFEAKSGQRLSYQADEVICVWLYAPDNQIITDKDLLQTGKYIIQVSAPKGSTTFDLKLGLNNLQTSISTSTNQTIPTSSTATTTNILTSEHPAPDNFVRNHYIAINNRQYSSTWNNLSSQFINNNLLGGYSEYERWWNSVKEIKIGSIQIVNKSNDRAVVDADLWYSMKDGKMFKDSKNRILLIWNNNLNRWLIERKS